MVPFTEPVSSYPQTSERTPVLVMGPFLLVIGVTVVVLSLVWVASVAIPRSESFIPSFQSVNQKKTRKPSLEGTKLMAAKILFYLYVI